MVPQTPSEAAKSLACLFQVKTAGALVMKITRKKGGCPVPERTFRRYMKGRKTPRRHSHQPAILEMWMNHATPIPSPLTLGYAQFLLAEDESKDRRSRAAELVLLGLNQMDLVAEQMAGVHFVIGHALLHLGSELTKADLDAERIVSVTLTRAGYCLADGVASVKTAVLRRAQDEFVRALELSERHRIAFAFDMRCRLGELSAKVERQAHTQEDLQRGLDYSRQLIAQNPHEVRAIVTALYVAAVLTDEEAAVEFGRLFTNAGLTVSSRLPHGRTLAERKTEQDRWLCDVLERRRVLPRLAKAVATVVFAIALALGGTPSPSEAAGPIIPLTSQ